MYILALTEEFNLKGNKLHCQCRTQIKFNRFCHGFATCYCCGDKHLFCVQFENFQFNACSNEITIIFVCKYSNGFIVFRTVAQVRDPHSTTAFLVCREVKTPHLRITNVHPIISIRKTGSPCCVWCLNTMHSLDIFMNGS